MTAAGARRATDPGLAFLGRVVGGQCHELTNVLNVVGELCGLEEDLASRAGESPATLARVAVLLGRVRAQLERGLAIVRNVHRLAGSVGAAGEAFDAREVVARAVFLASRESRLRQVALTVDVPDRVVEVQGDPFRLAQAIHLGIELLLDRGHGAAGAAPPPEDAAAGRRVTVTLTATAEGARVALESLDPVPWDQVTDTRLAAIAAVLRAADGELREMPRHAALSRLALSVPRRPPAGEEVTDAA